MKRLLFVLLVAPGCAHGLNGTIDGIEKSAAGTSVVIDEASKIWAAGVEAQVAYCKAKGLGPEATEEERAACMGILGRGDEAEPALDKVSQGYDLVVEGLELMRAGAEELEPYLEAAEEAAKQ